MKTLSVLSRVTVCALVLGTIGMTASFAQTPPASGNTPAPAAGGRGGGGMNVLTADEKAQYEKARDAALAADPDLKKEADGLKAQMAAATREDRKALRSKMADFDTQKLRPAMLKIDPNLGPIFAKIDAARSARRGAGA